MQCAEVAVRILEKEGIVDAFGIPGASINPLYKYLADSTINHHLMRHEEAAVHAADGYFRSSGKLALATCTSGPGATNLVTGLYTAWIDSIPLIAISGQGARALMGIGAFQCIDIAEVARPICKKTYCVMDPEALPHILQEAIWTAREGRMGPVLIDFPIDVQNIDIPFELDSYSALPIIKKAPDAGLVTQAIKLIDTAEKPLIIMGGGVVLANGEKSLLQFAEFMNIPVITTYMAKGGIPENHPLNAGMVGIQVGASSSGNSIFLESDLIIGIVCRFTDRHTGNVGVYKGNRKFIHLDVDPKEIGKIIKPEIGIVSDAALGLESLLCEAKNSGPKRKGAARVKDIAIQKQESKLKLAQADGAIDPRVAFDLINTTFNDDTLFTTGCGLNQIWSGQYQTINKPRKYLPSGGAGTLGFDIPAGIGASVGLGRAKTVCVMGDFGFTFMVEELAVAAKYKVPLVVIILNNEYLSLIRQNQKYAYKYEFAVHMDENKDYIDYVGLAQSLGCKAERVSTYADLQVALDRAAVAGQPYVIDVVVENETDCNMGNDIAHIVKFC